ncbi:helix-turn-helix transcriptional regulator [Haliea sp. E17]|uniref:helix-turn-helix transcriptional regulator n=1 Tax=Haliea sp. E17 TaxID=3401576 RepID=UPI003AB0E90B
MRRRMSEYEQLCSLGLPTSEVVPLALGLLESMLGGGMTCFVWSNPRGEAENSYILEDLPADCPNLYAQEFYNRREAELGPTFTTMLRAGIPLVNFSRHGSRPTQSAMYSELLAPFGLRHLTRVSVIDGDRRHGMLALSRRRGDRPHSEKEEELLLNAARHLGHAFELERVARLINGGLSDNTETGFILLDRAGRLQHGCNLGLHLFHEATRADGLDHRPAELRLSLPAALAARARERSPGGEITVTNQRGEFVFRPLAMRAVASGSDTQVAVTVHRRGSMAARLWRASGHFRLSGRERQVAVLLGVGKPYEAIADHLGISRNTAESYVRRTYEKLGTSQREQLIRTLLTGPQ